MSSRKSLSILDLSSLEKNKIDFLFSFADQVASGESVSFKGFGKTGALLFFEASTRTRMSFETACVRMGVYPLLLDGAGGTSLEKGETLEDTVLNVEAMQPDFLVIRCGDDLDLKALSQKVSAPILNAGWGRKGHPSQALLDAYTIRKHLGTLQGQRVLIVGDVRHSRVASSHFELAQKLGYEIALCGPAEFLPERPVFRVFDKLADGLAWASVAMALRVQLERHSYKYSLAEYRSSYGFTFDNLKTLSANALIMHPGPINHGTEMDTDVLQDARCVVLDQVRNGVFIRQALIALATGEGDACADI